MDAAVYRLNGVESAAAGESGPKAGAARL